MTGCENIQCILSVRLCALQIVSSLYSNPLCQTLSEAFEMSKKSHPETLKYWVGVQQGQSYLMGKGASLALVGNPCSDGVTIKMPYPQDFEILRWCPAGTFLPHGEKVPL